MTAPARSLARMSMVELQEAVRKDPTVRAAAWAEIRFRNQSRQAFERENTPGRSGPPYPPTGIDSLDRVLAKPWNPPDLSDPEPPREGPMV
jgi:hypothetical protein